MKICMYHVSTACCNQFASATDVYIHIYIYIYMFLLLFVCFVTCERYLGVTTDDGQFSNIDHILTGGDKVGFQWEIRKNSVIVLCEVVTPMAVDVARRGVALPTQLQKGPKQLCDLDKLAFDTCEHSRSYLEDQLCCSDIMVTCNHIGTVGVSGVCSNTSYSYNSTVAFEWVVQVHDCKWKEQVQGKVRDCITHGVPRPSCHVTYDQLHKIANDVSKAISDRSGFSIDCMYRPN